MTVSSRLIQWLSRRPAVADSITTDSGPCFDPVHHDLVANGESIPAYRGVGGILVPNSRTRDTCVAHTRWTWLIG